MAQTIDTILRGLAETRWQQLRKDMNRNFMCFGPGPEWEAWQRRQSAWYDEEALLSQYLGREPMRGSDKQSLPGSAEEVK